MNLQVILAGTFGLSPDDPTAYFSRPACYYVVFYRQTENREIAGDDVRK